jgi:hypothetical protein
MIVQPNPRVQLFIHGPKSESGQSRRLSDVGMSASPPTSDVRLPRTEPTLWAICDIVGIEHPGIILAGWKWVRTCHSIV